MNTRRAALLGCGVLFTAVLPMAAQTAPAVAASRQTPPTQTAPSQTAPAQSVPELPDAPSATSHTMAAAEPTGPTVLLQTTMGRLRCQLFDKEAPETAANFVGLATGTKAWFDPATQTKVTGRPFYDGLTFHRVIPGFMIQGGDPLGSGLGDAGYYLPDEISPALRFDVAGRLAMANSGPNTSSSQFFITEQPYPTLNGHYTIFGQCDPHSVLLVSSIARVERSPEDKPYTPVVIQKVTVIPSGQPVPPDPAAAAPVVPAAGASHAGGSGSGSPAAVGSGAPPAAVGSSPHP